MKKATSDFSKTEAYQTLCTILGHQFKDPSLLRKALEHPSYNPKSKVASPFQRLEFLGDRVLGLAISEELLRRFPKEQEGEIARRYASLVDRDRLSRVATDLQLKRFSIARASALGGKEAEKILVDTTEALLGALYLDGGFAPAKSFILKTWEPYLLDQPTSPKDPKSELQEYSQALFDLLPEYTVLDITGPDHNPVFTIELKIGEDYHFKSTGHSKKDAERKVAKLCLNELKKVKN